MKLKDEFIPKDWTQLQGLLFNDSFNEKIDRIRSPYIYRGLSNNQYPLKTSLMRLGGRYERLEFHLLRNFKKYSHRPDVISNTEWDWLALAQHHGLPTRLLDWTYSPYVAMHFATTELEKFEHDGVIWALNYEALKEYLPAKLRQELSKVGSNSFTSEMLWNVYSGLAGLSEEKNEFVVAFESKAVGYCSFLRIDWCCFVFYNDVGKPKTKFTFPIIKFEVIFSS